jgi:hypothetical protein
MELEAMPVIIDARQVDAELLAAECGRTRLNNSSVVRLDSNRVDLAREQTAQNSVSTSLFARTRCLCDL